MGFDCEGGGGGGGEKEGESLRGELGLFIYLFFCLGPFFLTLFLECEVQ